MWKCACAGHNWYVKHLQSRGNALTVHLTFILQPHKQNEPAHGIMVLFVLYKLVLLTRIRSHPLGYRSKKHERNAEIGVGNKQILVQSV